MIIQEGQAPEIAHRTKKHGRCWTAALLNDGLEPHLETGIAAPAGRGEDSFGVDADVGDGRIGAVAGVDWRIGPRAATVVGKLDVVRAASKAREGVSQAAHR